jgi:hypothetical protein
MKLIELFKEFSSFPNIHPNLIIIALYSKD